MKIVIPFTLPDHTVPQNDTLIRFFHDQAYSRAAAYYREELQQQIVVEENGVDAACRLSFDPDIYYNPDALPIRIKQPWKMLEKLPVCVPSPVVTDPLQRLVPGYERSRIVLLLFENSLRQAIDATGHRKEDEDIKLFLTSLVENCFHSGLPEEEVIKWLPIHCPAIIRNGKTSSTAGS